MARAGWGNGVCAGDVDNDGFEDLLVTYWGPNVLYHNNGHGGFEDVTRQSGLLASGPEWSSGVDGQGFEDIEEYGVERWLDELAQELRSQIYRPLPERLRCRSRGARDAVRPAARVV
jgi:FG-GAP-like repeat